VDVAPAQFRNREQTAKPPLADDVYRQLTNLIVSLKLSPGTTLSKSDLTGRLGVSRTPIRQVLQRLQQEGFAVVQQVGSVSRIVVAPMTLQDMRELHAILGVLEGLAARAASELPDEPRAALAARLRQLNAALRDAWLGGAARVRDAQDLHVKFHRAFVEAAARRRLRCELDALQPQVERYGRVYTAALASEFHHSLDEHEVIAEAIASGEADWAERSVIENWRKGTLRYANVVRDLGERGSW
jgi:GntR family transcriptional regulator, rspAB operon transcriptional repressor